MPNKNEGYPPEPSEITSNKSFDVFAASFLPLLKAVENKENSEALVSKFNDAKRDYSSGLYFKSHHSFLSIIEEYESQKSVLDKLRAVARPGFKKMLDKVNLLEEPFSKDDHEKVKNSIDRFRTLVSSNDINKGEIINSEIEDFIDLISKLCTKYGAKRVFANAEFEIFDEGCISINTLLSLNLAHGSSNKLRTAGLNRYDYGSRLISKLIQLGAALPSTYSPVLVLRKRFFADAIDCVKENEKEKLAYLNNVLLSREIGLANALLTIKAEIYASHSNLNEKFNNLVDAIFYYYFRYFSASSLPKYVDYREADLRTAISNLENNVDAVQIQGAISTLKESLQYKDADPDSGIDAPIDLDAIIDMDCDTLQLLLEIGRLDVKDALNHIGLERLRTYKKDIIDVLLGYAGIQIDIDSKGFNNVVANYMISDPYYPLASKKDLEFNEDYKALVSQLDEKVIPSLIGDERIDKKALQEAYAWIMGPSKAFFQELEQKQDRETFPKVALRLIKDGYISLDDFANAMQLWCAVMDYVAPPHDKPQADPKPRVELLNITGNRLRLPVDGDQDEICFDELDLRDDRWLACLTVAVKKFVENDVLKELDKTCLIILNKKSTNIDKVNSEFHISFDFKGQTFDIVFPFQIYRIMLENLTENNTPVKPIVTICEQDLPMRTIMDQYKANTHVVQLPFAFASKEALAFNNNPMADGNSTSRVSFIKHDQLHAIWRTKLPEELRHVLWKMSEKIKDEELSFNVLDLPLLGFKSRTLAPDEAFLLFCEEFLYRFRGEISKPLDKPVSCSYLFEALFDGNREVFNSYVNDKLANTVKQLRNKEIVSFEKTAPIRTLIELFFYSKLKAEYKFSGIRNEFFCNFHDHSMVVEKIKISAVEGPGKSIGLLEIDSSGLIAQPSTGLTHLELIFFAFIAIGESVKLGHEIQGFIEILLNQLEGLDELKQLQLSKDADSAVRRFAENKMCLLALQYSMEEMNTLIEAIPNKTMEPIIVDENNPAAIYQALKLAETEISRLLMPKRGPQLFSNGYSKSKEDAELRNRFSMLSSKIKCFEAKYGLSSLVAKAHAYTL